MSRNLPREAASCPRPGKRHYATREQAYKARRRTRSRQLEVYRCRCGHYCIGRDWLRRRRP
jgi:hypothetical protein